MEDKAKKIEIINKLLTLAEGNENPGERLSAKAKAYGMMNDYNILECEIPILAEKDQGVHCEKTNNTKVYSSKNNVEPNTFSKSVNLLKNYLGIFALVVWQIIKIPIVWQSLFLIGYFAVFMKITQYLIATKQTMGVVILFLGSIMLFGRWIKNFFVILFLIAFGYVFYTAVYSFIQNSLL